MENRWKFKGFETFSGFSDFFFCGVGGTEFAVEGAVSLCSHRAEACQRQPEQLGLCQSLRSAVLSNSETGSPE